MQDWDEFSLPTTVQRTQGKMIPADTFSIEDFRDDTFSIEDGFQPLRSRHFDLERQ